MVLLYGHLDTIFKNLPTAKSHGQLRSLSLLCEILTINYYKKKDTYLLTLLNATHKELMIACCFDWMISHQKVACQARAMLTLYYLGTEFDWIHPELEIIIQQQLPTGSAGYKNRGQKILLKIKDFQ